MKCNKHNCLLDEDKENPTALYCPMCKAESNTNPLDLLVRVQHVLQGEYRPGEWQDIESKETLSEIVAWRDECTYRSKGPYRIVKRTDELIAP